MEYKRMQNDEQLEKVSGGFFESKDIETKVICIIAEQLDVDKNRINLNSRLIADFGADGLDMLDILKEIENAFDVCFSESVISTLVTVGDIVNQIEYNI